MAEWKADNRPNVRKDNVEDLVAELRSVTWKTGGLVEEAADTIENMRQAFKDIIEAESIRETEVIARAAYLGES
jgi:hypothetical protein